MVRYFRVTRLARRVCGDRGGPMTRALDPRGAVILVTGGGDGIGRALCLEALRRGATVVAIDHNPDQLAQLARERPDQPLSTYAADVTDAAAMREVVEQATAQHGRLDVVVANAGVERIAPVAQMTAEDFEHVINVNVLGVYRSIKPCLEPIMASGGHVVAVSSLAALMPFPYGAAYAASKAAVDMLMRILRLELLDSGATAGAAYFGFVLSGMGERVTTHPAVETLSQRLPAHLLGLAPHISVEEVAVRFMDGIERRRARIYAPWSVRVPHFLRGSMVAFDDLLGRHVMRLPALTRSLFGAPDDKSRS